MTKYGDKPSFKRLDAMQPGLGTMLILQVWAPRMNNDLPFQRMEAKVQVVGITRLLCESTALLRDPNACGQLLVGVVKLLSLGTFWDVVADTDNVEFEVACDVQYSRLIYASKEVEDPLPNVANPTTFFRAVPSRSINVQQRSKYTAFDKTKPGRKFRIGIRT